MQNCKLPAKEMSVVELIWRHEPVSSGELVKLCEAAWGWKKSTTYTMLKRLIDKKIVQNENSMVESLIKKEEFYAMQSNRFVEETFGGSLPKFLAAFTSHKKLSDSEAEELKKLIENSTDTIE